MQPALQVQALFKVGLAAPRWGVCCIQPQGIQGDNPQGLGSWRLCFLYSQAFTAAHSVSPLTCFGVSVLLC